MKYVIQCNTRQNERAPAFFCAIHGYSPFYVREVAKARKFDSAKEAKAYANDFIGVHLQAIGGGKSYSEVSAAWMANPKDQKLAQQRQTMFMGETLRGTLLGAWGWGTMGTIATIAGIVLIGIGAVLLIVPVTLAIADRKRAEKPVRGAVPTAA